MRTQLAYTALPPLAVGADHGPPCAEPALPLKFVEIKVYVREPGAPPTVSLADVSRSLPGSFVGTAAGHAPYPGQLVVRIGVIGYRYTFLGAALVVGHSYWLSVARPDQDLGGATFTSAGGGPWVWTYVQLPMSAQRGGGGVRPIV
ncbi:hypothetical protein AAFP30_14160 [Gordonia sp. CPCC 205515]|uniref:hypothetical protein n=1 Tax=Gordonia sp. CPCC 205515 TaxID=3140791 RepID=UPI003AF36489